MSRNIQTLIAKLMVEDAGMTSVMSGATSAQQAQSLPYDGDTTATAEMPNNGEEMLGEPEGFTEKELKLAKRFIELIGGADRARELIDKVDECEDCLQLIDDEEVERRDVSEIEKMAGIMPGLPDLPMGAKTITDLSVLYNPSAVGGMM